MSQSASPGGERAQETADTGFTEAQLATITSVVRGVLKESQGPRATEEGGGAGEASGSRSDGAAGEWGQEAGGWIPRPQPISGRRCSGHLGLDLMGVFLVPGWQEVKRAPRAGPDGCGV